MQTHMHPLCFCRSRPENTVVSYIDKNTNTPAHRQTCIHCTLLMKSQPRHRRHCYTAEASLLDIIRREFPAINIVSSWPVFSQSTTWLINTYKYCQIGRINCIRSKWHNLAGTIIRCSCVKDLIQKCPSWTAKNRTIMINQSRLVMVFGNSSRLLNSLSVPLLPVTNLSEAP